MVVTGAGPVRMNVSGGMLMGWTWMPPVYVCVFCDRASPPYIRVASPTAASFEWPVIEEAPEDPSHRRARAAVGAMAASSTAAGGGVLVLAAARPFAVGTAVADVAAAEVCAGGGAGAGRRLGHGRLRHGLGGRRHSGRLWFARAGPAPDETTEFTQTRRSPFTTAPLVCVPQAERVDPPAGRIEQSLDGTGQPGLGQVAHDPGALDQADLAVLLGDDDHDRIGLFGDAEGGPMTRPEALGLDRRLGQRQERPGRHDPVVADDHGPVVERRLRGEDRAQQVGRDVAVDHHAGLGDLFEARLALEHDEGALAIGRQFGGRPRDLGRDVDRDARLRRRQEPAERPDPPDPLERPAQLGLEDDDQREQADDRAGLEDLGQEDAG